MKLTSEAAREQMFTRRTLFVGAATGGRGRATGRAPSCSRMAA